MTNSSALDERTDLAREAGVSNPVLCFRRRPDFGWAGQVFSSAGGLLLCFCLSPRNGVLRSWALQIR